jgi:hypothetical protein
METLYPHDVGRVVYFNSSGTEAPVPRILWDLTPPTSSSTCSSVSFIIFFLKQISLCSPGCPQTHNPPASASWVLGLQACTIIPSFQSSFFLSFFFFFEVLGFELRVSHLLGRHGTTWAMPPALFCFSYFLGRVLHFVQDWPQMWSSYLCLLHSWDYKYELPHSTCWLR